jgi:fibronectin type 3 domain-containing protein
MRSFGYRAQVRATLAAAVLILTGCGYVGGPLTPLANVPAQVTDLSTVQRGDILVVRFTVPFRTTEAVQMKTPVKLDLRIGTASENFKAEEWASQARQVPGQPAQTGIAIYRIPSRDWTGKEVVIGVRAIGSNGKESDWSNYAIVRVVPPPETPSGPRLENGPAGVHVIWTGGGDQFRVLRRTGAEETYTVVQTIAAHEYTDNSIEYGKPYVYRIQALVDAGNQKFAESDLSAASEVFTPQDTFPPAVPSGLRADAAGNSVALVWEGDTEPDLAGYRVYRSTAGGAWQKLADGNAVPSYSDATVEHGKTYRYAVSAIDKAGNESDRSAAVEIVP